MNPEQQHLFSTQQSEDEVQSLSQQGGEDVAPGLLGRDAAFAALAHQAAQSAAQAAQAAAAGYQHRAGSTPPGSLAYQKVPVSRKEEVQKLIGQALVLKCDPNSPYLAPIVIMNAEENNVYGLLEKHFRPEFLLGAERFWKVVRNDMNIDTWRPRVQGQQLKALVGARLPESEEEMQHLEAVLHSLQDSLKPDITPAMVMADLRNLIGNIQAWWENRNKRPDGKSILGLDTVCATTQQTLACWYMQAHCLMIL